jgi:hypothetical protein
MKPWKIVRSSTSLDEIKESILAISYVQKKLEFPELQLGNEFIETVNKKALKLSILGTNE